MNLWVIFLTGLTVGGLTCLAVQGGLLASVIASGQQKNTVFSTMSFLVAKLVAYTVLGALLGAFGGALGISPPVQIAMQAVAGFYMIAIGLNLLNVHPIFKYAVIQPPKLLSRLLRNQSKSNQVFAPGLLGAMTVFIPCGTTLAMEALAVSSASAFTGAAVMFVFVLGTTPLFFGVGWLTAVLGDSFKGNFLKVAAVAVLYLGITSINGALVTAGSPVTLQSIVENSPIQINLGEADFGEQPANIVLKNGVQVAQINVLPDGYNPTYLRVQKGLPVRLGLTTSSKLGCTSVFRIPLLGITKTLKKDSTDFVEFTPAKAQKIVYTCSMGMYSGVIEVI